MLLHAYYAYIVQVKSKLTRIKYKKKKNFESSNLKIKFPTHTSNVGQDRVEKFP